MRGEQLARALQFCGAVRGVDSSSTRTSTFRQYKFSERKFYYILFQVIRHLKRVLPSGPQRKREVDYVLDRISETMTPMHYHSREVIFSTFNLVSEFKAVRKVKFLVEGAVIVLTALT